MATNVKHFISSLPHRFSLTADAAAGGHNGCVSRWLPGTQHGVSGYTDPPGGGDQHERPAAHSHDSSVRSVRLTATQLHLVLVMCKLAICDSYVVHHGPSQAVITAMLLPVDTCIYYATKKVLQNINVIAHGSSTGGWPFVCRLNLKNYVAELINIEVQRFKQFLQLL